jgi:Asp-tRNA(Asn)/Glu-tRNA(Gln) amidotransferase A subunit family amidase
VPVAIGSDGAGSTRLPPAYCGVTGIHTSRGRIPHVDYTNPTLALTSSIGPIARDVRDVAQTLHVMAGPDGRDFVCMEDEPDDYVAATDTGVEGLRLAWTSDFGFGKAFTVAETPRVVAAIRQAVEGYSSLGARVDETGLVWDDPWPHFGVTSQVSYRGWPAPQGESGPTPEAYREALAVRARSVAQLRGLLADHDLVLSPTTHSIAPTIDDCETSWLRPTPGGPTASHYLCFNVLFNWVGWPALTVPCGFVDGLPIGLQIAGPAGSEGLLLRAARALETLHPAERPPIS